MVNDIDDDIELMNSNRLLKCFYYNDLKDFHFDISDSLFYSSEEFAKSYKTDHLILSLNCCSLLSKLEEIKLFINTFGNNSPIAIALQEIHRFQEHMIPNIKGYNFYFNMRTTNKGGGVGIFVRDDFIIDILESSFHENILESICLKVTQNKESFIICNFYRPPSANIDTSIDLISELFTSLSLYNLPVLVTCDSNIDVLKKGNIRQTFLGETLSTGFINHINIATRICPPSMSSIDQLFSNNPNLITNSGVFIDSPSDHFWTFISLNMDLPGKHNNESLKRIFSQQNIDIFRDSLKNVHWSTLYNIDDVNQAADFFSEKFLQNFKKCFPLQNINKDRKRFKLEPWFTKGLLTSRKEKYRLFKKWKSSGKDMDKKKFVLYRNLFNKIKQNAKRQYYATELSKTGRSSKKHWSILKTACGLEKSTSNKRIEIKDNKGCLISDANLVGNTFNQYFSHIGKNTAAQIPKSQNNFKKYMKTHPNSVLFMPMGPWRFLDIVSTLSDKRTEDINEISIFLLRQVSDVIAEPLSYVFDLSIFNGIFPDCFKCSKVVPVYKKKGSKDDITNYRPISIVNSFGKILEKHVVDQILKFFLKENIMSDVQHAFLPGRSTFSCILSILNTVSSNIINNELSAVISFDLSKAFDLCDHQIILDKLEAYGVRGVVHSWFKSFLQNRTQRVAVNGSISTNSESVELGVPQGSVIGVLLFLVYINDLPNCSNFPVQSFADDSSFIASAKSPSELEEKVNAELPNIIDWFHSNRLSVNVSKSCFMIFSPNLRQSPRLNFEIKVNDSVTSLKQIPDTNGDNSMKLLGFYLDERLSIKDHISHVCKSISKSLFFLSRVKNLLPLYCRKQLYFAHIHSHLMYCLPLLSIAYQTDINRLEKLQRKALRITYNLDYRADVSPLYHDIATFTVTDLIQHKILSFLHKVKFYGLPRLFKDFWTVNYKYCYLLRDFARFEIPLIKSIRVSHLPQFKFAEIYNNFSGEFKWISERSDLIDKLRNYYHHKYAPSTCTKNICKICCFEVWKREKQKYIIPILLTDYIRYS